MYGGTVNYPLIAIWQKHHTYEQKIRGIQGLPQKIYVFPNDQ